jgi:hypothetical protein
MSESAITVVEISLPAADAPRRAVELTGWLLDVAVIEPNTERDDLWQASEYRAGPQVLSAAPEFDLWSRRSRNNGVDVVPGRGVYHPYENYEPPDCPTCNTTMDEDTHTSLIEPWLAGPEPRVTCRACRTQALLGDWIGQGNESGQWTFQVGELAVSFNNWPALNRPFLTELGGRMGPRWRVVSEHR